MATIVIIEDNPANLELMHYLLDAFGHHVLTATDGGEGLDLVRQTPPELIICDVHLPKVDGYEVARTLKSDPRLANIPLLAVTALAMVGDREKGLAAGFDGYLFKPIEPETFVSDVERFLAADRHGISPLRQQSAHAVQAVTDVSPKHAKILVIDESIVNLELVRDMLEPLGYEVWLTKSAAEGYARACENTPDMILSDLHMPEEDGFGLFRRIKLHAQLARIPFVFISATVRGDKDRETAVQIGATRFLVRPIEPETLIAEIAAVLAEHNG